MEKLPEALQRLLDEFYSATPLSQSTQLCYHKAILSFWRATGNGSLGDLCNQALTKWYEALRAEDYAPGSIVHYMVKLRALYAFSIRQQGYKKSAAQAKAMELFEAIPLGALRRQAEKANRLRDKLVTPEEFAAILNAADHPRVRAFLVMLYESAARPDELLGLRIRDITWRDRYVTIRIAGKTGERTIPLVRSIPYLRAWLLVHPKKADPDAPLFIRPYKGRLEAVHVMGFEQTFKHLKQKAGITRRIHPYLFRHTRLTELTDRGLGEFHLKQFAGWTLDSRMAARYIHLSGRSSLTPILELEGIETRKDAEPHAQPIRLKVCPRCGSSNEMDATHCHLCHLILDDKLLHAKLEIEQRTDNFMDALISHPAVRSAIQEAVKELVANGKLQYPQGKGET